MQVLLGNTGCIYISNLMHWRHSFYSKMFALHLYSVPCGLYSSTPEVLYLVVEFRLKSHRTLHPEHSGCLSPLPYQGHPNQSLHPLMFFSSCSILSSCNPAPHWISLLCHALPSRPPVQPLSFAQPELPSMILILSQSCPHTWLAMQTNTT